MSNVSASDFLRSAEKDYSSNKNQQFFYQKTAKKSRKFLKKGPFAAIITAMISFAAIIFAGGSLLGFQLHDLITTVTDVQHTTNSLRKPSILKNFLKNSSAENNFPKSLKAKFKNRELKLVISTVLVISLPQPHPKTLNTPSNIKIKSLMV